MQRNKYSEAFTFRNLQALDPCKFPSLADSFHLSSAPAYCTSSRIKFTTALCFLSAHHFKSLFLKYHFYSSSPFENHPRVFHCLQKVLTPQFGIDPVVSYLLNIIFHLSFTQSFPFSQTGINSIQRWTPFEIPLPQLFSHHSFPRTPLLLPTSSLQY